MRSNKGANNRLEQMGRKLLWQAGLRGYRINVKGLPGRPDVVFIRWKVAVFFHGCFWHDCEHCGKPASKTNSDFWAQKMRANRTRDEKNERELINLGYRVVTFWEHELKTSCKEVPERVRRELNAAGHP